MKAVWKDTVIAESDATVMVEGNHYFPEASVNQEKADSRPFSQPLTLVTSFHHSDGLGFDPCHKALDARVNQQGLNRVQLLGQFRLGKQGMNLAVTDTVQVLRISATFGLWD